MTLRDLQLIVCGSVLIALTLVGVLHVLMGG